MAITKSFETMRLSEMQCLHIIPWIIKYDEEISELKKDKESEAIVDELYGDSIMDIVEAIENQEKQDKSEQLFPNAKVKVYLGIEERIAHKEYTCDFSGAHITKGSLYVSYRPMLKNLKNGETYVLKRTLRAETIHRYELPTNIKELEEFMGKIENYENQLYDEDKYNTLYVQTGGGLEFKKLNRRKHENRYR
ncbi:MAG: hypothetical protein IK137_03310 [Bacilli bacterium]|nr:hypothetical protein [Bacilli bacterium]